MQTQYSIPDIDTFSQLLQQSNLVSQNNSRNRAEFASRVWLVLSLNPSNPSQVIQVFLDSWSEQIDITWDVSKLRDTSKVSIDVMLPEIALNDDNDDTLQMSIKPTSLWDVIYLKHNGIESDITDYANM